MLEMRTWAERLNRIVEEAYPRPGDSGPDNLNDDCYFQLSSVRDMAHGNFQAAGQSLIQAIVALGRASHKCDVRPSLKKVRKFRALKGDRFSREDLVWLLNIYENMYSEGDWLRQPTTNMGHAILEGDLEKAVRWYIVDTALGADDDLVQWICDVSHPEWFVSLHDMYFRLEEDGEYVDVKIEYRTGRFWRELVTVKLP